MIAGVAAGILARRRSREGAWIEITATADKTKAINSRSREGAWIEIWLRNEQHRRRKSLP